MAFLNFDAFQCDFRALCSALASMYGTAGGVVWCGVQVCVCVCALRGTQFNCVDILH